MIDLSQV